MTLNNTLFYINGLLVLQFLLLTCFVTYLNLIIVQKGETDEEEEKEEEEKRNDE